MSWEMWVIASIACIAGISGILLVVLALPGIWAMVLVSAICMWWRPEIISWRAVVTLASIAVVSEIMEMVASAAGAKKFGGSKRGAVGAIFGTMIGAIVGSFLIPIPVVGTIVGGIVGAGIGAMGVERSIVQMSWKDSMKSGSGAAIGRTISIFIKLGLAIVAALFFVLAAFV